MTEDHDSWIPDMILLLLNRFYLKTKSVHIFSILIKTLNISYKRELNMVK